MSDSLFDRYREVLRAGHVAVLRGRLEDAATAYREAATLAGDRAVPRAALGSVQLRLGQPEQALAAFDEALGLAPTDDAALLGRAQALVVLERPHDAAATFDALAEARWAAGKHADAGDALRRALEIQPTAARRQRYQELADELRQAVGAAEAERALARARRYLETEAAPTGPSPGETERSSVRTRPSQPRLRPRPSRPPPAAGRRRRPTPPNTARRSCWPPRRLPPAVMPPVPSSARSPPRKPSGRRTIRSRRWTRVRAACPRVPTTSACTCSSPSWRWSAARSDQPGTPTATSSGSSRSMAIWWPASALSSLRGRRSRTIRGSRPAEVAAQLPGLPAAEIADGTRPMPADTGTPLSGGA